MKTFHCTHCDNPVFFENTRCLQCGQRLAFLPDFLEMRAFESDVQTGLNASTGSSQRKIYRLCDNAKFGACNWAIPDEDTQSYCVSCRRNVLIPDLAVPRNIELWQKIEYAKRRLFYTLLSLQLPLDGNPPLRFQFPVQVDGAPPVQIGHANGLITINVAEADDATRESQRVSLHEPFRTLLGHFRHEAGHYYWERLIKDSPKLDSFRQAFGDERLDYGNALQKHYRDGPPSNWLEQSVSAYASAHPWEDWAETWAHYLHMLDTIETASSFGLSLNYWHPEAKPKSTDSLHYVKPGDDFGETLNVWTSLTHVLNSFNRGMGIIDLYPFTLSSGSIKKLRFVHDIISEYFSCPKDVPTVSVEFPVGNSQQLRAVV